MQILKKQRLFLLAVTLIPTLGTANNAPYDLINDRLDYMKAVAAYKWVNNLPIENHAREQVVIERAAISSLNHGITISSSEHFFRVQIGAAKDIQHCWFERWKKGNAPDDAEDLDTVLRPALIDLGDRITASLHGKVRKIEFDSAITVDCLSKKHQDHLFSALVQIEQYPDQLAQITTSRLLRVGTTGDYAPFSHRAADGGFTGIDIDLARDLASSLGADVLFIHTSWPTLMDDLRAGSYDIAMSGESITPERGKTGYYSKAYHSGGKTPITLCSRVHEFDALEKIDMPGVRLIVNPGGTNERYIDTSIKRAKKVLHDDNRTIFGAIVTGNADLMITDSIEVDLQSRRNRLLCPAMPGQLLTNQQKGFLMPKDNALKNTVDKWLHQRLNDGTVERLFSRHLSLDLPPEV